MATSSPRESYIERTAQAIWAESEDTDVPYPDDEAALWLGYAVLALALGERTTSEDVHDAWSAWAAVDTNGAHKSLVPYTALPRAIMAYDDHYRDAIHAAVKHLGLRSRPG